MTADQPDLAEQRALLVARLRGEQSLRSDAVAAAFAEVPRERFIPDTPEDEVYLDRAIVTRRAEGVPVSSSSQPAVMALMLELLDVRPGHRVLEIGAGTGYNAALLARLVGPEGRVTTVDVDAATAVDASRHLAAAGVEGVAVVTGDGVLGASTGAPYDRIIATASAREIPPAWIAQLQPDGRVVLPFRLNRVQVVVALDRVGDALESAEVIGGGFMPLRSPAVDPHTATLPDGSRVTADVPIDDALLASIAALDEAARPAPLPMPAGPREAYPAFVFVALQGAPVFDVSRWDRDELVAASNVLATSTRSALRWPLVPSGRDPEVLGEDEALDFVRGALMRWREAGEPGVERLRVRVTPAHGAGALGALPRPVAGAYRFVRGAHAYELRIATP